MTGWDSPAARELQNAINQDIVVNGEVICVQRLVNDKCTLRVKYAYQLLKACAPIWGFGVDRLPCKTGGFVLRVYRL